MPAKRLASDSQLEILLAFMEKNPDVANAKPYNSLNRQRLSEVWDDLTMHLNAESSGCTKTQRQWRDYWQCKKYSLNKKRFIAKQQRRAAACGQPTPPSRLIFFTEWEARMVKILTSGQGGQGKVTEPIEVISTSVKDNQNMIQETKENMVNAPYDEADSNSAAEEVDSLVPEDIKIELVSYSPAQPSSPEDSPPPISPIFIKSGAAFRRVKRPIKRPYHQSIPTAKEIRLAAEDKILAKEERRLAEKERRMAAEDRRLAAEDRRLAAEDRQLAIQERKIAVQERRLAEEERRKASDSKITRALHTMSQKISRLSAEFEPDRLKNI